MKYEIAPSGRLVISVEPKEAIELRQRRKHEPDKWVTHDMEVEVLEPLIANSELDWIPEGATQDLTNAPMLGIMDNAEGKWPELFFGMAYERPIIARWAYMNYAVRSFLDDLADKAETVWEGGYADPSANLQTKQ